MKQGFIVLASVVLMLSCGGRTQTAEQDSMDQIYGECINPIRFFCGDCRFLKK